MLARRSAAQGTVEWVGLLLLVALLIAALYGSGIRVPGTTLASAIAERMVCAVRLTENCRDEPRLKDPYGHEIAALLRAHAPTLLYEDGMTALPVDYRGCRADGCAEGARSGPIDAAGSGRRVVAFTRAIDCRGGKARPAGADCSGSRARNLFLQYWFYYPGSATAEGSTALKEPIRRVSAALGKPTFHPDDWESYQVRIGPGGRFARASSHHGYNYELGGGGLIPGFRVEHRRNGSISLVRAPQVENGWGPDVGTLYVSGGSHAGNARIYRPVARTTHDHRLKLVPIERLEQRGDRFAVSPPWRKRVYLDPEYGGTD